MQVSKETVRRCLLTATALSKGVAVSDVTGEMVMAWFAQATAHGFSDEDFKAAFQAVIDRTTFFPAWAEVLQEHGRRMSDRFALITDPVHVIGSGGEQRIGSRAACVANGTAFTEVGSEPPQCLPATDGGRRILESVLAAGEEE